MKYKAWRKQRPECGQVPAPGRVMPYDGPRWFVALAYRCRRLDGHRGRHAGSHGRWS